MSDIYLFVLFGTFEIPIELIDSFSAASWWLEGILALALLGEWLLLLLISFDDLSAMGDCWRTIGFCSATGLGKLEFSYLTLLF